MKTNQPNELIDYIETPRREGVLVKIDEILEARMKEFIRVRRTRRITFMQ